jgi:hypothetical protein
MQLTTSFIRSRRVNKDTMSASDRDSDAMICYPIASTIHGSVQRPFGIVPSHVGSDQADGERRTVTD